MKVIKFIFELIYVLLICIPVFLFIYLAIELFYD